MTADSLIDSNLLVYAFDRAEGKKHEKAREFLFKAMDSKAGTLSSQNLAEFHYNMTKKKTGLSPEASQKAIMGFCNAFRIISYNQNTVIEAIGTETIYGIHFWDALLATTMQENKIRAIYTENTKDFRKVPWLKAINPLE